MFHLTEILEFSETKMESKFTSISREECEIHGRSKSRQEFCNEYLVAKIGVDKAENGPVRV